MLKERSGPSGVGVGLAAVVIAMFVVGLVAPASAHHRPGHTGGRPSPEPSPSTSPTENAVADSVATVFEVKGEVDRALQPYRDHVVSEVYELLWWINNCRPLYWGGIDWSGCPSYSP